MKNYFSSFAVLLFVLFLAISQIVAAAAPSPSEATDDILAQNFLDDVAYEQYYPSDLHDSNHLVARDAAEDELVDPAWGHGRHWRGRRGRHWHGRWDHWRGRRRRWRHRW